MFVVLYHRFWNLFKKLLFTSWLAKIKQTNKQTTQKNKAKKKTLILFCYCCTINLYSKLFVFFLLLTAPSGGDTLKQPFYGELSAISVCTFILSFLFLKHFKMTKASKLLIICIIYRYWYIYSLKKKNITNDYHLIYLKQL